VIGGCIFGAAEVCRVQLDACFFDVLVGEELFDGGFAFGFQEWTHTGWVRVSGFKKQDISPPFLRVSIVDFVESDDGI